MFGFGQFDDEQLYPVVLSRLGCIIARVALIDIRQCNALPSGRLDRLCQRTHLSAVLLIGRGHQQGQQMPQGIHRHVRLAAFASFGPIVSPTFAAFGAGLQRATVQNGGTGGFLASGGPIATVPASHWESCSTSISVSLLKVHNTL